MSCVAGLLSHLQKDHILFEPVHPHSRVKGRGTDYATVTIAARSKQIRQ
jgi:hypothetical protein